MKAKIGVGVVTYNRADYFKVAIDSVLKHLDMVDEIVVVDDGSTSPEYDKILKALPARVHVIRQKNAGVGPAKNACFKYLLGQGCDFLFIMEDDLVIKDRMAVVGYLAAHKMTNFPHLLFSYHGDNRQMKPVYNQDSHPLAFWPNCVGAWCFYTREVLERVGLMDENFHNAYEHVEHSWRIFKGQVDYGGWPDVWGSYRWVDEQPQAIANSSIRTDDEAWRNNIRNALAYWRSKDPNCPANDPVFPD